MPVLPGSYRPNHRLHRGAGESLLQQTSDWISKPCEQPIRPRVSENVVPYRIVRAPPLDRELFLSAFSMIGQSAVNETVPPALFVFVNHAEYPAGVQRPEAEVMREHGYAGARLDRRIRPTKLQPTDVEHLPSLDRFDRSLKDCRPVAELDAVVVGLIA